MKYLIFIVFTLASFSAYAQENSPEGKETEVTHKWRVSIPYIVPDEIIYGYGKRTSIQMVELHVKRKLDNKNIVGVKFATWRLFQPMGITWWDGVVDKIESGSDYYDGYLRETGIGVSYQRMLWKGLFASVEVLPQIQTYTDLDGEKIKNGFKLYNSLHLGYHAAFGKKKRFFIEPQVHINQWMFDNNSPEGFKEFDDKYGNVFLFEPNIYFGFNF
ncbi:hypothetical protein [Rhodohalobacter sulfatireducens]|uniref:DUF3575 domain-containing protein n=1 Tax=Rhodohalobacter sulfatireducens TaxID=2911366 RepID=A0ABS9KGK3_9BACT|nr:hypothetical protein [Rhodohalobacter sulfatireducens]MCG2589988.1 hypothetical protein [Rhodohalobacter sulfatireducens]